MNTILIADDDREFLKALSAAIRSRGAIEVLEAYNGNDVLELVQRRRDIQCILLDYSFDKWGGPHQMNGLQIAAKLKHYAPEIEIIMMSEVAGIRAVNDAHTKEHIQKFLDKSDFGFLLCEIASLLEGKEENTIVAEAKNILAGYGFHTKTESMKEVCRDAVESALTNAPVLIIGETGSGKSRLAQAIHAISVASGKRTEQWERIYCSAVEPQEFSGLLFGVPGQHHSKQGIVNILKEGCCFLDEISDIPQRTQAQLCRFIENAQEQYEQNKDSSSARIIASTNANIREAIVSGRIRRDLYYRFDHIIALPSLRDRSEDIPLFIEEWLGEERRTYGRSFLITPQALSLLQRQPWIGNLRQLRRVLHRAALHSHNAEITEANIQRELRIEYGVDVLATTGSSLSLDVALSQYVHELLRQPRGANQEISQGFDAIIKEFRREIFNEMLKETNGNKEEAARRLGLSRLPKE